MKKRLLQTVAVTLTAIMTLSGCGNLTNNTTDPAPDTSAVEEPEEAAENETVSESGLYPKVTMALQADPENLEPSMNMALGTSKVNWYWNLYETLFDYDDDGNLVPDLASGYEEISSDCWRVTLFDSIHDSEGNPVTVDDVMYCFDHAFEVGDVVSFDIYDHIEKVDDYTMDFYWTSEATVTTVEFPLCRTQIYTQTAYESHQFATDPVATGNYVVSEFIPGSKVVLTYDKNYWGNDPEIAAQRLDLHVGNVEVLELDVVPEAATAAVGLQQDTIDICTYVQMAMLNTFQEGGAKADRYNVTVEVSSDYMMLEPNMSSNIFSDDLNLRLAIFYGIDNEAIATAMGGSYVALKAFGVSYYNSYDPNWEEEENYINTYNKELAKEYLDKSNYNGETIRLICNSAEAYKNGATMMVTELDDLGINVELQAYTQSELDTHSAQRGDWDMRFVGTGGPNLISSYRPMFKLGFFEEGVTSGYLSDEKLNSLFDAAMQTDDSADVKQVIDYALENGYIDCIVGEASVIVVTKDVASLYKREGHITPTACTYNVQ
ncbi:MAG: ABC transporter substrate-binding protein [Lachnospiraceae bacterium]|nr:ABC transporter substrate-binding protein [Lachnospiraceae bacterium]